MSNAKSFLRARDRRRQRSCAGLESLETRRLFALAIAPTGNGTALANALLKPSTGVTITNVTYVGTAVQGGTYSGFSYTSGNTSLSIGNGVELSSGNAADATDPTTDSTSTLGAGDTDLTNLINAGAAPGTTPISTYDANSLTITFTTTPGTKSVAFDFIFGSNEFPAYVGEYNDPFGAYLDGKQISFDSNSKPITVNNNFFTLNNSGDTTDPDTAGKTPVTFGGLYVYGLTPKITTTAPIDPTKTTHTLKFAIADAGDTALNSYVFLSALRGDDTSVTGPTTGQPPTAEAAGPYTVAAGATVVLNGSGTDPNQAANTLTYAWDLDGDGVFGETGAAAANGTETGAKPTFNSGSLAAGTVKTVTLKVTDSTGLTATDTATVTITPGATNTPLAANPGGPYSINEGSGVTLNGSATGGSGGYAYAWDLDNDGAFDDATGATPTLTSAQLASVGIKPDGNASYPIKLQVTSGSSTTTASGSLAVKNVAPTVNAGADKSVVAGNSVTLAGTASDPAGALDPLTYSWVVKQGSTTVATGSAATLTFTPATAGSYVATLTVTDGDGGSTSDSATVTATTTTPPVTPPTGTGPSIVSFTLVDADTEKDVMTLTEGATLNRALLPAHLNIRANTNPGANIKVQFGYDEVSGAFKAKYRTETGAPYALFSNLGSDYFGKVLGLGAHTVTATGITYKGVVGAATSLHFTVVDQPAGPGPGGAVTGFTLVDADKDKDIYALTDHQVIDLKTLSTLALNIRANVTGSATSLIFGFDGKASFRTELGSPFALFSNLGLDYFAGTLTPGEHTLTATPYSGPKGTGTAGASMTITFTVIG